MDSFQLLYLCNRALSQLAEADSEEAWRFKLADFVSRLGEITQEPPAPNSAPEKPDSAFTKLAEAINRGYEAKPHRNTEHDKHKIDYLMIMGGDCADDSILVFKTGPSLSAERLTSLLRERMTWGRCRTKPEAVKRLRECFSLTRAAAEHRVNTVCSTYNLSLDAGSKFGRAKKGGPSLA